MTEPDYSESLSQADAATQNMMRLYALMGIVAVTVRPSADGQRLAVICPDVDKSGIAGLLVRGAMGLGVEPVALIELLQSAVTELQTTIAVSQAPARAAMH